MRPYRGNPNNQCGRGTPPNPVSGGRKPGENKDDYIARVLAAVLALPEETFELLDRIREVRDVDNDARIAVEKEMRNKL